MKHFNSIRNLLRVVSALVVFATTLVNAYASNYNICWGNFVIVSKEDKTCMLNGFCYEYDYPDDGGYAGGENRCDCDYDHHLRGKYKMDDVWHDFSDAFREYNVISISSDAFRAQPLITELVLSKNLEYIPDDVFNECTSLAKIYISVKNPFFSTTDDPTIYPPNSTDNMFLCINTDGGKKLMWLSSELEQFTIPADITDINQYAFLNCKKLTKMELHPDNPWLAASDGVIFRKDIARIVYIGKGVTEITMPSWFGDIPNEMMHSGNDMYGNITKIVLPWDVYKVGANAFDGCTRLETVVIGERCKNIGDHAFNVDKPMTVYCNAAQVPAISETTFSEATKQNGQLIVPVGRAEEYSTAEGWRGFKTIVEDASGVEDVSGDEEGVQISVAGGELTVSGCANVEVYAANGLRIYAGTPDSIGSLPAGLYIVRAGGRTAKVRL